MSPIKLADFDSGRGYPDSPSYSGDEDDSISRQCTCKSTYAKVNGEQDTGDKVNEPIAIVGIGKLLSSPLCMEKEFTK